MAAIQRSWAADLLHVWFHEVEPAQRFNATDALNAKLRRRFEGWLDALHGQPALSFVDDPGTALAAVLLFDQIPRNLYSGSPRAFAYDRLARAITRAVMARGWDAQLSRVERQFLAMPLMHSEHIADQRRSLAYFTRLGRGFGMPFARDHYRMVARFGRFPHRNKVLGRTSTPAEKRAVEAGFAW